MHSHIASLLLDVEKSLRELGCWEQQPPAPDALASAEPFAVDTLAFNQWLQFVFLPRMIALVEAGAPLPANCGIAPMAEEYFKSSGVAAQSLIAALTRIDQLLSDGSI